MTSIPEWYQTELDNLISKETALRYDHEKSSSLTLEETKANQIFEHLRKTETDSLWDNDDLNVYPGMDFHGARHYGLHHYDDSNTNHDENDAEPKEKENVKEKSKPLSKLLEKIINSPQHQSNGIEKGKQLAVWQLIRKMPKGALLHVHFDGSVDVRFLIQRAVQTPGMCIKSSEPLNSQQALHRAKIDFQYLVPNSNEIDKTIDIYSDQYVADTWIDFNKARQTFPFPHTYVSETHPLPETLPPFLFPCPSEEDESKSSDTATKLQQQQQQEPASTAALRFDSYLYSLMTLTPYKGVPRITNSNQAWDKFSKTFGVISGLLQYEPTYKAYIKQMLKSHAADGIGYTEVRMNFFDSFMVGENGKKDVGHRQWVKIYEEAVNEVRTELEAIGLGDTFYDSNIIYVTVRIIDNSRLREYLEDCIELKKEFPHRIVGFDLVGHEDPGIPLRTYLPELFRFKQRQTQEGLEIPFVFHAGETLTEGEPADENLYDAILLQTKRIGHGISLSHHPLLSTICKQKDICIEICPISNQLLGYTLSTSSHPSLLHLLNQNVPIVLSCDDPAIFENFGLSYDFYQLAISSKSTSLASLSALARRSIKYSLVDDQTKQIWFQQFDKAWNQFILWVIETYPLTLSSS